MHIKSRISFPLRIRHRFHYTLMTKVYIPLFVQQKNQKYLFIDISGSRIAGDERIELPPKVLETPIIPFDQSPLRLLYEVYMQKEQLSIAEKDFSKNIHFYSETNLLRNKVLQPYAFLYQNKTDNGFYDICRLNKSKNSHNR